jgi:hypothetical protein
VQRPFEVVVEQFSPVLAVTVTVPVGATTFVDPTTENATKTGWFGAAGFGDTEVIVVIVVPLVALVDWLAVAAR